MHSRTVSSPAPATRSEGLLIRKVGDEAVVYDLETKEAHCLKPLAAFVFESSGGPATIGELADRARAEVDPAVTDEQVLDAVAQLEEIRLLSAPSLLVVDGNDVSRREMMRRVGYAGAVATVGTGLVTSIAAPTALAACSNQPAGCNCAKNNPDCASNHCCSGNGADRCNVHCCASDNNGQECKCQANGLCGSIPQPTNCCLGTCTPTTGQPCTAAAATSQLRTSTTPNNVSGTGGGTATTPTTPTTTTTTSTTATTPPPGQ
jgi:hypothetical protein